jgi:hypothetical protein
MLNGFALASVPFIPFSAQGVKKIYNSSSGSSDGTPEEMNAASAAAGANSRGG